MLITSQGPGRIFDITLPLSAETVVFESPHGLGNIRDRSTRIEEGDLSNQSFLKELPMHLATHVDAPGHFVHVSERMRGRDTLLPPERQSCFWPIHFHDHKIAAYPHARW